MQRIKNTAIPRNPTSVHEINEAFKNPEILQHFGYTLGDDDTKDIFFDTAIDTGTFSYAVFSSKKQINSLNEYVPDKKMHILMDATFRTCPKGPFNQLLILYARIHHKVSKTIRRMIILSHFFFKSTPNSIFFSLIFIIHFSHSYFAFLFFRFSSLSIMFFFPFFFSSPSFFYILGIPICIYINVKKKSVSL